MPLHKNGARAKRMVLLFDGFFKSEPFADSFQIEGVLQDWYSDVLNASGQNPDEVFISFGGEVANFGQVRQVAETLGFRYEINCIDNSDVNHVYTASEWRDNVLRCLNNNVWIPDAGTLTVTPIGIFTSTTVDGKAAIEWVSLDSNFDPLIFPSPILVNANRTLETNTADLDQLIFPKSRFTPLTAEYNPGNRTVSLVFAASPNVRANEYFDVGRQFGTATGVGAERAWLGIVTSRTLLDINDEVEVILDVIEGNQILNVLTSGTVASIIIVFQPTIPAYVVVTSDEALQVLDTVESMNAGYTFEGTNTNADLFGDVIVGTAHQDVGGAAVVFFTFAAGSSEQSFVVESGGNNPTITANTLTFTANAPTGNGYVLPDTNYDTPALADAVEVRDNITSLPEIPVVLIEANGKYRINVTPGGTDERTLADLYKCVQFLIFRTDNTTSWKNIEAFISARTDGFLQLEVYNSDASGMTFTYPSQDGWDVRSGEVTRNIPVDVLQTFADDPNREMIADGLGVRFFGTATRAAASSEVNTAGQTILQWVNAGNAQDDFVSNGVFGPGQLPMISMGRGASLNLNRGIIWNVSDGYDMHMVAADGLFDVTDLSVIRYDGEQRNEYYDDKFGWDVSLNARFLAVPAPSSIENPMTVNQLTGCSFQLGEIRTDALIDRLRNDFFVGSRRGQRAISSGRLIWNVDGQPSIGIFSAASQQFASRFWIMPGERTGRNIIVDFEGPNSALTQLGGVTKDFGGENIIIDNGRLEISDSGDTRDLVLDRIVYDVNVAVLGNWRWSGNNVSEVLRGFFGGNTYFIIYNTLVGGFPYFGDFEWSPPNNPERGRGQARLGVLWNPSWIYNDLGASNIYESYYYNRNDTTTLTPVKEMLEQGQIGVGGIQEHPWAVGIAEVDQRFETLRAPGNVAVGETLGVQLSVAKNVYDPINSLDLVTVGGVDVTANVTFNDNSSAPAINIPGPIAINEVIDITYTLIQDLSLINVAGGNNKYTAGTGWGTPMTPSDGILLAYSVGVPSTNGVDGGDATVVPFASTWFSYTRRDGFRPYFTQKGFQDDFTTLDRVIDLNAGLDASWQTEVLGTMDILATQVEDYIISYDQGSNTVSYNVLGNGSWNTQYRALEVAENRGTVANAEDRPRFDPTGLNINGLFNRTINLQSPITEGLIHITDYDVRIDVRGFLLGVDSVFNVEGVLDGIAVIGNTLTLNDSSAAETGVIQGRIIAQDIISTQVDFDSLRVEANDRVTTGLINIDNNSNVTGQAFVSTAGLGTVADSTLNFTGGTIMTGPDVALYTNATVAADTYTGAITRIQSGSVFSCTTIENNIGDIDASTIQFTTMNGDITHTDRGTNIIGVNMVGTLGATGTAGIINESDINITNFSNPIAGEVMDTTLRTTDVEFGNTVTEQSLIFANNILVNDEWSNSEADGLITATMMDGSSITNNFDFTDVVLRNFHDIVLNSMDTMTNVTMAHTTGLPPVNLTTTAAIDGTSAISARTVSNIGAMNGGVITASSSLQCSGAMTGGLITTNAFTIGDGMTGGTIFGQLASSITGDMSGGVVNISQPLTISQDITGTAAINATNTVSSRLKTGGVVTLTGANAAISFTGHTVSTAVLTGGSIIGGFVNGLQPSTASNTQTFTDTTLNLTTAAVLTAPAVSFSQESSGNVILGEGPSTGQIEFVTGGLSFARDETAPFNANIIIVAPYSSTVTVPAGMTAYLFVGPPAARVFDRLLPPGITTLTESDFSVGVTVTIVALGTGFSQVLDSFLAGVDYVVTPVSFTIPITSVIADDAIVNVFVTPEARFVVVMNNLESINPRMEIASSNWPAAAIHQKVVGGLDQFDTDGNTYQQTLADWIANKPEIVPGSNIILFQVVEGTLVQFDETRWEIDGDESNDRTLGYILAVEANGTQLANNAVLSRPNVNDRLLNVFPVPTSTSARAIVDLQEEILIEQLNKRKVTEGTLLNTQLAIPEFGPDQ